MTISQNYCRKIPMQGKINMSPIPHQYGAHGARLHSPVNILKDPPQIATEGFSMVLRPEGFLE